MRLVALLYNFEQRRPRAGVRILVQLLLMLAITLPLTWLLTLLARAVGALGPEPSGRGAVERLLGSNPGWLAAVFAVRALGVVASVWLAARWLDRRPFGRLGVRMTAGWWRECAAGFVLGGVLMGAVFAIELGAGWIRITDTFHAPDGTGFLEGFAALLVVFSAVGFYEELLARGYLLSNLAEGLVRAAPGRPGLAPGGAGLAAWLLSSLMFGVGHGLNPNVGPVACLGVAAAGLLLGLPFLMTGRLGMPVGLHLGWNLFQGGVFGFPVSGRGFGASLIAIDQQGPDLWTGGSFGPEAGMLGLLACLAGGALAWSWLGKHGGSKPDAGWFAD